MHSFRDGRFFLACDRSLAGVVSHDRLLDFCCLAHRPAPSLWVYTVEGDGFR